MRRIVVCVVRRYQCNNLKKELNGKLNFYVRFLLVLALVIGERHKNKNTFE